MTASGGCTGGSGGDSSSVSQSRLALIGDLQKEESAKFASNNIRIEPFDISLTSPDAAPAVMITDSGWDIIAANRDMADAVYKMYHEGSGRIGRVVLYKPTSADVSKLMGMLGQEFVQPLLSEEDGGTQLSLWGVGKHLDGDIMTYAVIDTDSVSFIHDVTEGEGVKDKIDENRQGSVELTDESFDYFNEVCSDLNAWLAMDEDPNHMDEDPKYEENSSKINDMDKKLGRAENSLKGDKAASNLAEMAARYHSKLFYAIKGGSYAINNYIVAVHHFADESESDGGMDWYYIQQEGVFNGGTDYAGRQYKHGNYVSQIDGKEYWVGGAEVIEFVAYEYTSETYLTLHDGGNISNLAKEIVLTHAVPIAINNVTTHTTEHSFNIGGSAGWSGAGGFKAGADASLSFGYGYKSSETFDTHDVAASLSVGDSGISPKWTYKFKIPERGSPWTRLREGAELGHSTYTPWQMWAWGIPTRHRNAIHNFVLNFKPTIAGVYSRNSGSISPRIITERYGAEVYIVLPKPPLLAVEEKSFIFSDLNSSSTRIKAQGGWRFAVMDGSDWITATQSPGRLDIQVDKNTTGASRKGKIRVTSVAHETNFAEITVTQLK